MRQQFADSLINAQGRSEFVIVVVADIRGFSKFSTVNESPNIAMFIKRFYLQLINKYFKTSNFVKPTGDGLLMTFPYTESNLLKVSEEVIQSCVACLDEFPTICDNDPMINFATPQSIGFGIARGTACCLYSGDETIDYSGHLLNLASRLNDLARPRGIVIDGGFQRQVIPEATRELFKEQQVFVRSIAEETPIGVFYLDKYVQIPDSALNPMVGERWETETRRFTPKQFAKLYSFLNMTLPATPSSPAKVRVTLVVPKPGTGVKTMKSVMVFKGFECLFDGPSPKIKLNIDKVRSLVGTLTKPLTIRVDYVPKPLPRT